MGAQQLDRATATLDVATRSLEQAKLAYEVGVAGATVEERGVAKANVAKAEAANETLKAQVVELTVKARWAGRSTKVNVEVDFGSPISNSEAALTQPKPGLVLLLNRNCKAFHRLPVHGALMYHS